MLIFWRFYLAYPAQAPHIYIPIPIISLKNKDLSLKSARKPEKLPISCNFYFEFY